MEKLASTVKLDQVASISCGKVDGSDKDGGLTVRRGLLSDRQQHKGPHV